MEELKIPSRFRMFVNNKYYEFLDENNMLGNSRKTVKQYFNENKWFLKRLYKEK